MPFRGRPTLVFDLMEEWRSVLLDPVVWSLVRLHAVGPTDIDHDNGRAQLSARSRRLAIERFRSRLSTFVDDGNGRSTYEELLQRQAVSLRRWIFDNGDYRPHLAR